MVSFEWLEVSYSAFQKKNVVHLKIVSNVFHEFHCVLYVGVRRQSFNLFSFSDKFVFLVVATLLIVKW